jgi:hypothetical protein
VLRILTGLAFLLLGAAAPLQAAEVIRSFHSDIEITAGGDLIVTETIQVQSEGKQIKRGIYRDFPTLYTDRYGNRHRVLFDVIGVTRGGVDEDWHTRKRSNGVRIYAGNSDTLLPSGIYTYTFTYRTNRQIGFFQTHDELYWNVTGNGWEFPIEYVQAAITLPEPVTQSAIEINGYTGSTGAKGTAYRASAGTGGGTIETTDRLAAQQGLTVSITWPKGVIEEPGALQKLLHLLQDNFGLLASGLALVGSFFYLLLKWVRVGRDPPPGVIFPHYEPPEGYSPASARYINRMGITVTFKRTAWQISVVMWAGAWPHQSPPPLHRPVLVLAAQGAGFPVAVVVGKLSGLVTKTGDSQLSLM